MADAAVPAPMEIDALPAEPAAQPAEPAAAEPTAAEPAATAPAPVTAAEPAAAPPKKAYSFRGPTPRVEVTAAASAPAPAEEAAPVEPAEPPPPVVCAWAVGELVDAPYSRGDLVWSKIYGFPWWPSQIRSVRGLTRRFYDDEAWVPKIRVRFLHTNDNAELTLEKVLPFTEENRKLGVVTQKPKMFKSKNLETKFKTAVAEGDVRHAAAAAAAAAAGGGEAGEAGEGAAAEVWSDDEVVELEEVEQSRADASASLDEWKSSGHDLLGKHIARFFGVSRGPKAKAFLAVVTRWLDTEDGKLFHVRHDDGDEEDLDEEDIVRGVAAYSRQASVTISVTTHVTTSVTTSVITSVTTSVTTSAAGEAAEARDPRGAHRAAAQGEGEGEAAEEAALRIPLLRSRGPPDHHGGARARRRRGGRRGRRRRGRRGRRRREG